MRRAGRIAPGSCGAVLTGQSVFLRPAFTAATNAMLSFLVRPFMVGTVIGGSLGAESFAVLEVVLEAVTVEPAWPLVAAPETGVADAVDAGVGACAGVCTSVCAVELAGPAPAPGAPSMASWSSVAEGRASLLAAQASDAKTATVRSASDELLLNRVEFISWFGITGSGGRGGPLGGSNS